MEEKFEEICGRLKILGIVPVGRNIRDDFDIFNGEFKEEKVTVLGIHPKNIEEQKRFMAIGIIGHKGDLRRRINNKVVDNVTKIFGGKTKIDKLFGINSKRRSATFYFWAETVDDIEPIKKYLNKYLSKNNIGAISELGLK